MRHAQGLWRCLGIRAFARRDGGYTTLAMAVALLVSLTLVFGMAAAQWSMARAADVQEVADATAMAGENCVAAFSTVAQVVDACVLTMGLTGVLVCGAGLVVAAIPPLQAHATGIMDVGRKILDARKGFARSAAQGLGKLEAALPALIMANSASCAAANSQGGVRYAGLAVPFPQTPQTDFSSLEDEVDAEEMVDKASRLADASQRKEEAHRRANEAKARAWTADNVDSPLCLHSRAATLAGLEELFNPWYPSPDVWEFEYARARAQNYYYRRYMNEFPEGDSIDELQRSAAREQFYGYAYEQLDMMTCKDEPDNVFIDLWVLPHTTSMVRETRLYTDVIWPCTAEEDGLTLHCSLECPGALGEFAGSASLEAIDMGDALRCDVCCMDAHAMGNVASASTYIDNGFEHYWRIVVDASKVYEAARCDEIEAERDMDEAAESGKSAFDRAIELLAADRPSFCPPGSWGCVSVVYRPSGTSVPTELTRAFLHDAELPAGAAISAATLAPDSSTQRNTVLARAFDGLRTERGPFLLDLVGNVTGLWSDLLVGYGSAYGSVRDVAGRFFDGVEGVFGQRIADKLRGWLADMVPDLGMKPADITLRKPVIVNSQVVLDKAGYEKVGEARTLLEEVASSSDGLVGVLRQRLASQLGSGPITIAELPIPGLEGVSIPLTIDLSEWGTS